MSVVHCYDVFIESGYTGFDHLISSVAFFSLFWCLAIACAMTNEWNGPVHGLIYTLWRDWFALIGQLYQPIRVGHMPCSDWPIMFSQSAALVYPWFWLDVGCPVCSQSETIWLKNQYGRPFCLRVNCTYCCVYHCSIVVDYCKVVCHVRHRFLQF